MADDLKALSAELARDPDSLVFLQVGEALRRRGQIDAAQRVAVDGIARHPELVDAHDLYARVLVDQRDFERAAAAWHAVLEREGRHVGAHKGLGFLEFRFGNLDAALEHLETALGVDPTDQSVVQALRTVREAAAAAEPAAPPAPDEERSIFAGLEGAEDGLLLVDDRGRRLGGGLCAPDGRDVADEVAGLLAGAAQEAERTARVLELGHWEWMVVEGAEGNLYVTHPTAETLLLVVRDRSVPSGRLTMLAGRAAMLARQWLEGQQL